METIFTILLEFAARLNYLGIFLLMSVESSFIPFPSEIVVPPAAYMASKGELNIYLVILFGILGSLCGASINYVLARYLGRSAVYALVKTRIARYLFITEKKIEKAEEYFLKYGNLSTFLGRLVPAVRQLISLPAGFSKMSFPSFVFFTFLGSGLWVCVLAILGYFFGANEELFHDYYTEIVLLFLALVAIAITVVVFVKLRNGKLAKKLN